MLSEPFSLNVLNSSWLNFLLVETEENDFVKKVLVVHVGKYNDINSVLVLWCHIGMDHDFSTAL